MYYNDEEDEEPYVIHCDTPSGSCVILTCSRRVWMLRPVAPQSQTIQLLRSKNYSFAMELIDSCLNEGATWAETAFAQTAFLLLHGYLIFKLKLIKLKLIKMVFISKFVLV